MTFTDRQIVKINALHKMSINASTMSTCKFTHVGCVITTNEFKPVSFGYNGTVSGHKHCCDMEMTRDEHVVFSDQYEVHAEMNAIIQGDRNLMKGGYSFTTISPCFNCMKHLMSSGVNYAFSGDIYWRYKEDKEKLIDYLDKINTLGFNLFIVIDNNIIDINTYSKSFL